MSPACTHLLVFEGEYDGNVFGLNFSSSQEAKQFKSHLEKRYEQEKKAGEAFFIFLKRMIAILLGVDNLTI